MCSSFNGIQKMSAPVLTISEQRAAISGKKKKKKALKNVLGIPDNLKLECPLIEKSEVEKLHEILNRLLPAARLPFQPKDKSDKDSTEQTIGDVELRENSKNKRDQLTLGVNALSRNIKKNLVSAALLADDIQPKFLTSHLNLLCYHNKVPFLHIPGLRKTTEVNLGFPCIAVGFKTNGCDFVEAIEEIKSILKTKKLSSQNETKETEVDSDSGKAEMGNDKVSSQNDKTPFTYLYRSSVKERVFIPEKDSTDSARKRAEDDFISVDDDIREMKLQKNDSVTGISSHLVKKQQIKAKKLQDFFSDDDEELEIPRKKTKKDWVIDKTGTKQYCKYYPAKLFRVPSNPNRNWKKNK